MSEIAKGAYVLATKYSDGDPGDAWAVGYYLGKERMGHEDRHMVGDKDGKPYRASGYRYARANLRPEVGAWLVKNNAILEQSPPGAVNLWKMLTDLAFEDNSDNTTGSTDGVRTSAPTRA
jgi:hypothetical protein